jgi:hypothetical protein
MGSHTGITLHRSQTEVALQSDRSCAAVRQKLRCSQTEVALQSDRSCRVIRVIKVIRVIRVIRAVGLLEF